MVRSKSVFKNHVPLSIYTVQTVFVFEGFRSTDSTMLPSGCDRNLIILMKQTEISSLSHHTRGRHVMALLCFRTTKTFLSCLPTLSVHLTPIISFVSDDFTASRVWDCFPVTGLFSTHHRHRLKQRDRMLWSQTHCTSGNMRNSLL